MCTELTLDRQTKPPKRVSHLAELQRLLDARFTRHSQVSYAVAFHSRWQALHNSDFANDQSSSLIPGNIFWADAVKLHLHWLAKQRADASYVYFGVSGSTANKLHKWTRKIV